MSKLNKNYIVDKMVKPGRLENKSKQVHVQLVSYWFGMKFHILVLFECLNIFVINLLG